MSGFFIALVFQSFSIYYLPHLPTTLFPQNKEFQTNLTTKTRLPNRRREPFQQIFKITLLFYILLDNLLLSAIITNIKLRNLKS